MGEHRSARVEQVLDEQIAETAAIEVRWGTEVTGVTGVTDGGQTAALRLAGDRAQLMAPFGARGLNSGVADAENSAWKIAFALHGWPDPALVDTYDLERRAAAQDNLAITTRTMDFLVPPDDAGWAHRREVLERAV